MTAPAALAILSCRFRTAGLTTEGPDPVRTVRIALLILLNLGGVVLSNVGFKWSAMHRDWRGFLVGQIVGNLAGFVAVLALTFLIRETSLRSAYAISAGIGFLLVEVLAAGVIFHEPLGVGQWLGTLLVFLGVLMITLWH